MIIIVIGLGWAGAGPGPGPGPAEPAGAEPVAPPGPRKQLYSNSTQTLHGISTKHTVCYMSII